MRKNKVQESAIGVHYESSRASKIFDFCNATFMILFCITILLPFWDLIVKSFSRQQDISYMSINLFPKVWDLSAYKYCITDEGIVPAFFMSVLRTVVGTVFHLVITSMAAYTMTRDNMPFIKVITAFLLVPMFIGAGLIPTFLNIKDLGMLDSFWVYILPSGFSIYNCIIIRNYFFSIDKGMEESAIMDGASYFRIFSSIIIPLSKPVLATVALWQIVGHWNAWFDNMIYNRNSQHLMTLQYLLRRMLEKASRTSETAYAMELTGAFSDISSEAVKAAVTVIVVLPIIIVYPFVQKYFVKGIMMGAVKG